MKPCTPYTAAEIDIIRARYPSEGAAPLVHALGRDRRSIVAKALALGLRCELARSVPHPDIDWTPEQDGLLRAEWPDVTRHIPGKTAKNLAARLGVTIYQARMRAAQLGLKIQVLKMPNWSEEEDTLLIENSHLSLSALRARLKKMGCPRSESAIAVRRTLITSGVVDSTGAYSGHALARMMGCSSIAVRNWIQRGWLKATPRTDAIDPRTGGPGDRWLIYPDDVRRMIVQYTAHINLHRADKFWLVDLLANDRNRVVLRQDRCGVAHEASGGYDEHEVRA